MYNYFRFDKIVYTLFNNMIYYSNIYYLLMLLHYDNDHLRSKMSLDVMSNVAVQIV